LSCTERYCYEERPTSCVKYESENEEFYYGDNGLPDDYCLYVQLIKSKKEYCECIESHLHRKCTWMDLLKFKLK